MNSKYCTICNETLTFHADGSVACGCGLLDSNSYKIPLTWDLSIEELQSQRQAENELRQGLTRKEFDNPSIINKKSTLKARLARANRAKKQRQIRSLMDDSGYSRSEATELVRAGF